MHSCIQMCVLQVIHGLDQHGLTNQLAYLRLLVSVGIINCFYLVYH